MSIKRGEYVKCEYCNKVVYKTLSQMKKHDRHFCSNKCQSLLKRLQTFEYRNCEICATRFYVSKKSTQRFCSIECQRQWQSSNIGFKNNRFGGGIIKCKFCNAEFLVGKYKYEDGKEHFCSKSCRQEWYAKVWSQSNEWKEMSRRRAVEMLTTKQITRQTKPQIKVNSFLDDLNIKYVNEHPFVYYSIDNYLPEYNLAIEVMGDYWHNSPLKYPNKTNEKQKHIISRDKAKHTYLKEKYGFEILYLWESDIIKDKELCCALIQKYIKNDGLLDNYHSFNYTIQDGQLQVKKDLIVAYQEIAC